MRLLNCWIVRAIDWAESAVAGDAALEFCRHFLHGGLFERIGAAAEQESGARQKENNSAGLQARRILGKVSSDK